MENNKRQKLFEVTSLQQGYFTAKQAVKAGYSYRMQSHYRQKGEWLEIDRGIFRLAQFPHSPDEDYVRWSLWSRGRDGQPQAVISHDSALGIHELSDIMPAKIHLTVPSGLRKNKPKLVVWEWSRLSFGYTQNIYTIPRFFINRNHLLKSLSKQGRYKTITTTNL